MSCRGWPGGTVGLTCDLVPAGVKTRYHSLSKDRRNSLLIVFFREDQILVMKEVNMGVWQVPIVSCPGPVSPVSKECSRKDYNSLSSPAQCDVSEVMRWWVLLCTLQIFLRLTFSKWGADTQILLPLSPSQSLSVPTAGHWSLAASRSV